MQEWHSLCNVQRAICNTYNSHEENLVLPSHTPEAWNSKTWKAWVEAQKTDARTSLNSKIFFRYTFIIEIWFPKEIWWAVSKHLCDWLCLCLIELEYSAILPLQ